MTGSDASSFSIGYARVYSSPDGVSHFGDEVRAMEPDVYAQGIPVVHSAEAVPATALRFSRRGPQAGRWHPAPRRQFVLLLSGVLEVTVGDGEVRRFGPGSLLFVEDTAGQGTRRAPSAPTMPYTPPLPCSKPPAARWLRSSP